MVLNLSIFLSDHKSMELEDVSMNVGAHCSTDSYYRYVPNYEEMACCVCNGKPKEAGPRSETEARVLEIGEERCNYAVLVCEGCKNSLWLSAKRAHDRDDWDELEPSMYRQFLMTDYLDLLKQRVMAKLRMEELHRRWSNQKVERSYNNPSSQQVRMVNA